jgi:hypothetical protein
MRSHLALAAIALPLFSFACSSNAKGGGGSASIDPHGADSGFDLDGGFQIDANDLDAACSGLECQRVACSGSTKTTVHGVVFDPSGARPLPNVRVFVPNESLAPLPAGVTCDRCGATVSGKPIVSTLTDAQGRFSLVDVPVAPNLPLVMQLGKWRRQITIPTIESCKDNEAAASSTRLPRNKSEGDIPLIAIATGYADPFECLLRKIGLDDAEFTVSTGDGRVHVFQSPHSDDAGLMGATLATATPSADTLWSSVDTLKKYDLVLLPCEGNEWTRGPEAQHLVDYTSAGGRAFITHYGYTWLHDAAFAETASWQFHAHDDAPLASTIDVSFPKGQLFSDWLAAVDSSDPPGQLTIVESRQDVASPIAPAQRWIYSSSPATLQHYTFNTPVGVDEASQCGRVVFSDFHVSSGERNADLTVPFPASCKGLPMSRQEKALEFMLFDVSSCIQKDTDPLPPR